MESKHKQRCGKQDITAIKTSNESNLCWQKHFQMNPLYFRIQIDIEADTDIDDSGIGKKATNIYKQNPVCNGY